MVWRMSLRSVAGQLDNKVLFLVYSSSGVKTLDQLLHIINLVPDFHGLLAKLTILLVCWIFGPRLQNLQEHSSCVSRMKMQEITGKDDFLAPYIGHQ